LPAVAAGALTIWLVFLIVLRIATPFAAVAAAALLAFDPLFLWLTRCDWGPVALEHLLAAAGVWLLLRFYDTSRDKWLAAAFLLFGLAFWNKATFAWMACGLLCGAFFLRRLVVRFATPRRIGLAAVILCLGAYPLIRYNIKHRGETAERTAAFETSRVTHKAGNLRYALDGAGIAGFLYRDRDLHSPWQLRRGFTHWLFGAALLLAPFLGAAGRCAGLIFLGSFLLMAITREAGESTHHLILLWPLPHIVIALALDRLHCCRGWARRLALAILAVSCAVSASVTATHYSQLVRNGSDPPWSDAIMPLAASLEGAVNSGSAREILVMDWGIMGPVRLLSSGRLPLVWAADKTSIRPGDLLVAHTPEYDQFPGKSAQIEAMAQSARCRLNQVEEVRDRRGKPVFRLIRCEAE
jgi:hypothetical protein